MASANSQHRPLPTMAKDKYGYSPAKGGYSAKRDAHSGSFVKRDGTKGKSASGRALRQSSGAALQTRGAPQSEGKTLPLPPKGGSGQTTLKK